MCQVPDLRLRIERMRGPAAASCGCRTAATSAKSCRSPSCCPPARSPAAAARSQTWQRALRSWPGPRGARVAAAGAARRSRVGRSQRSGAGRHARPSLGRGHVLVSLGNTLGWTADHRGPSPRRLGKSSSGPRWSASQGRCISHVKRGEQGRPPGRSGLVRRRRHRGAGQHGAQVVRRADHARTPASMSERLSRNYRVTTAGRTPIA
jgi:hypothetical protein